MAHTIRRAEYFYTTVADQPGEGQRLLSRLARQGVNLLAFTAVPVGLMRTQFTLFPDDSSQMQATARDAGFVLDGPHPALLVMGDDELGALAGVHRKLYEAKVNVYAASGVADGKGSYGCVVYIQPDQFQRAVETLGLK